MATPRMDIMSFASKLLEENDVDVLREGVRVLAQAVMETEVSSQIGAAPYERSSERVAYRNGYPTGRGGEDFPQPPDRRRAPLRVARCDLPQGPPGRTRHLGRDRRGDRGQRPGTTKDIGCGHRPERGSPVLDLVPSEPHQARAEGRPAGDLRCP